MNLRCQLLSFTHSSLFPIAKNGALNSGATAFVQASHNGQGPKFSSTCIVGMDMMPVIVCVLIIVAAAYVQLK